MSARSELIVTLTDLWLDRCGSREERAACRPDAEQLVNDFARELAEKVRDVDSWPEARNYAQGTLYTYRSFARRCAAQIDPEMHGGS